ncbi:MAG: oxygen-independent coproporphyrinogen-3 oxidase, partial [Maribacter sp.]
GASSISDSWYGFAQNVKGLEEYRRLVENNVIPVFKGHILSSEDEVIRKHILNLMSSMDTSWFNEQLIFSSLPIVLQRLDTMRQDGLIEINTYQLKVTQKGRPFVRNVCMAFDIRLHKKVPNTRLFSMTV